jgi:hypothetical protein
VYAKILIGITDDNAMKQYRQVNYAYFSEPMCDQILESVPKLGIYDIHGDLGGVDSGKERFLAQDWQVHRQNIEFTA